MIQKASVNQPATNAHGALQITTSLVETGIHFYVSDGVQRINDLSKTFTDREQAKAFYRHVAQAAEQGKRVHQIVWEIQALEEAQNAATGRTAEQIRDALNTDAAGYLTTEVAIADRLQDDADEIMAGADRNWKAKIRNQVVQAAKQANAGSRTAVPTASRVHTKPLTAVELDRVRNHADGVVTLLPGQSWTVLRAIWRRIGGEPTYRAGTQIMVSLRLTERGRTVADNQEAAA